MRKASAAFACALLAIGIGRSGSTVAKERFTVATAIEMARIMDVKEVTKVVMGKEDGSMGPVLISPDGERYALLIVKGDIGANGVWLEVISGGLDSLSSAAKWQRVARLFTKAEGKGDSELLLTTPGRLLFEYDNRPRWLDDTKLAFRWVNEANIIQVVSVDVVTRKAEFLTRHATHVIEWAINSRGQILYTANSPEPDSTITDASHAGFSVHNRDWLSYLSGRTTDIMDDVTSGELWVLSRGNDAKRIGLGDASDVFQPMLAISPRGRWAVMTMHAPSIPKAWDRYTEPALHQAIPIARRDPDWKKAWSIRQHFIVDLDQRTVRPLWNAPAARANPGRTAWPTAATVLWSPTGDSVLLAPTVVPVKDADGLGLSGDSAVEVDAVTGEFQSLPLPEGMAASRLGTWRWLAPDTVIADGPAKLTFKKRAGKWRLLDQGEYAPVKETVAPRIRIEVQQSRNSPPVVMAVESSSGRREMIFDPNAGITQRLSLGNTENVTWLDRDGRTWHGRLYYPVNYQEGVRYPLVIQTHGIPKPDQFSAYGHGFPMGPNYGIDAAQPLANRGMAVLQMEDQKPEGIVETPREAEMYMGAYQAAIDKWAAAGLADRGRIGITGFSRTGWHVQYALTHSDFPYAAAVTADNMDVSYVQRTGWVIADHDFDVLVGAAPFGAGLKLWLERSPGFNADKIRTPLQLQSHDFGRNQAIEHWEMFSRLRQLKRPVELYVIPDVQYGDHGIQNPLQCLAAQERAVDWLDFWLTGHEEPDSDKTQQYIEWRQLRQLQADARGQ